MTIEKLFDTIQAALLNFQIASAFSFFNKLIVRLEKLSDKLQARIEKKSEDFQKTYDLRLKTIDFYDKKLSDIQNQTSSLIDEKVKIQTFKANIESLTN